MLDMVNRAHSSADGQNSRKPMKWILVDAAIIAAVALWAVAPTTVPTVADLWVMVRAFGAAFFAQLVVERGLKREEKGGD